MPASELIPPLSFMLPGFSKSGTTTFVALLDAHPQLVFPSIEEPWFFSEEMDVDRWRAYRGLFPADTGGLVLGDDSTSYTAHRKVDWIAARVHQHYPDLRLVFVVRDPVARIESSFREFHHSGPNYGALPPFDLAGTMAAHPQIVQDCRYHHALTSYGRHYPSRAIKVVFFEDLVRDPTRVVRDTWRHLGVPVDPSIPIHAQHHNAGDAKLRDTGLLRRLRGHRWAGPGLARFPIPTQDRYLARIGLRRRHRGSVSWSRESVRRVLDEVAPDIELFTREFGRPRSGWPKYDALLAGESRTPGGHR